jgi:hypothetical protein
MSDELRIGVHWRHSPEKTEPDFYVTREQADELRARGEAYPTSRGRLLRMRCANATVAPERLRVFIRDLSCMMDERVIQANAEGAYAAAARTAGWAAQHVGLAPLIALSPGQLHAMPTFTGV